MLDTSLTWCSRSGAVAHDLFGGAGRTNTLESNAQTVCNGVLLGKAQDL